MHILSVCLHSCLSYPACKSHVFCAVLRVYCHLWPVCLCHIFPRYLLNATIFGKKFIVHKMFSFSLQLLSEIFLILRRNQRDIINVHRLCLCRYACQILMKYNVSRQIYEKIRKYQTLWKFVQWEPSCSMRTDRQTYRRMNRETW